MILCCFDLFILPKVRIVREKGQPWILVPLPPKNQQARDALSTVQFQMKADMLRRRLKAAENIVRCPECRKDTHSWYLSLDRVIQRTLLNITPATSSNAQEYTKQQQVLAILRKSKPLLEEAAEGVLQRSSKVRFGKCGFCGGTWNDLLQIIDKVSVGFMTLDCESKTIASVGEY